MTSCARLLRHSLGVLAVVAAAAGLAIAGAESASAVTYYTTADVAAHNTASNCWVIISGNVYDLTAFAPRHSGGASRITGVCGSDGSSTFTGKHSSLTKSVNTSVTGGATTFGGYLAQYQVGAIGVPADTTPPAAPTGLSATAGNTQVTLSWSGPADAATYQVFQGGSLIGTQASTAKVVTGLTNGILYSFTIKAVDAAGNVSVASASASATPFVPADTTPPAAPTGLTATAGDARVTLAWSGPADAATYQVFQGGSLIGSQAGTTKVVTGLLNGTTYSFTVKAVDAAGNVSVASAAASARPTAVADTTPPAAPTGLRATAGDRQVSLTWSGPSDAAAYQVFRGGTRLVTQAGTSYTATGLTNGTSYSFTVKAVDAAGNVSVASAAVSARPVAPPVAPTTPYTATQVAAHGTLSDCWVIIQTTVYNLTTFATTHSGGSAVIGSVCGKDGTALFTGQHGGALASHLSDLAPNQAGLLSGPATLPGSPGVYTKADIAKHASASDCWVGIAGTVYDLTGFIGAHSGGASIIQGVCGTDGTATFFSHHAPGSKDGVLAAYKVGTYSDYVTVTPPAPIDVASLVGGGKYTMAEVKVHSTAGDCWVVISGGVYGMSTFIDKHPGGTAVIAAMCGTDGTAAYNGKHGGNGTANGILAKLRMGDLVADPSAPAPAAPKTYTLSEVSKHATEADCWSIVNGTAYDLTKWIGLHPGGKAPILAMCGKDGSASFNAMHGKSASAKGSLPAYELGAVVEAAPLVKSAAATFTVRQVSAHRTIGRCWTIVNGNVYNITKFTKNSKYGTQVTRVMCGKNASKAYKGHAKITRMLPRKVLKKYRIGSLATSTARDLPVVRTHG